MKKITNTHRKQDQNGTFYGKRNDQPNTTPLPIIKINGKLKKLQSYETNQNINSDRWRFGEIDQNEVEIGQNESLLPTYRNKSQPISKKKINFTINSNNIDKQTRQQFENMFIHKLKKLSCDRRFTQKV